MEASYDVNQSDNVIERSRASKTKEVMHASCVTFRYVGEDKPVIDECTATVHEGEVIVISGSNGCGKSTLCRLLAGVMSPYEGEMTGTLQLSKDQLVIGYIGGETAQQFVIGVVEDELAFGPENLRLPPDEIAIRVERELSAIGMDAFREAQVGQLSGGQQQRVAAAAVWTMNPDVIIVDDAWSALDIDGRARFTEALYRWYISSDSSDCRLWRTLITATARPSDLDAEHPLWKQAERWELKDGRLSSVTSLGNTSAATVIADNGTARDETESEANHIKKVQVLELKHASARYRNGQLAFQNVSSSLLSGDGIVLRGSNGAGKSSLLKVLSGALRPYQGSITLQGKELKQWRPYEYAQMIGYVPQRAAASFITNQVMEECMDVYRQLAEIGRMLNEEAEAWSMRQLQRIGMEMFAFRHPHDLSASLQRKLSMWIATAHQPALLLLDEPTAGLDEHTALEVIEWCNRERSRGAAVLAVTHDPIWLQDRNWNQWYAEEGFIQPLS